MCRLFTRSHVFAYRRMLLIIRRHWTWIWAWLMMRSWAEDHWSCRLQLHILHCNCNYISIYPIPPHNHNAFIDPTLLISISRSHVMVHSETQLSSKTHFVINSHDDQCASVGKKSLTFNCLCCALDNNTVFAKQKNVRRQFLNTQCLMCWTGKVFKPLHMDHV